ncbi:roadblock/LC7 domain-containing protein [Methylomarinum vadi]|uniref:roadblock/LC7 domain-containing protein n=1 Tax=Methylomarinum vadi TaxID=438855 RepID=UPI0004DF6F42|nr:roadblock/LC7 domain-containing protein [Methylomarinum vadi]
MYLEILKSIMNQLKHSAADIEIEASEIVTTDGLSMAALLPEGFNEDRVGPMCAGAFAFGQGIAEELDLGELGQIIIKGSKCSTLINVAGDQTILTMKVKSDASMDNVSRAVNSAAEKIRLKSL